MLPQLSKIKGIHPGLILRRELNRNNIKSNDLANDIGVHKQTISAILNQRRGINPGISIKLAKRFTINDDYFMLLQASYEVKKATISKIKKQPTITRFRKVIFWDTSIDKIDWDKNKNAVIKRVLERGNKTEIEEIILFYGKETIFKEIKIIKKSYLPSFENNIREYNLI